MTKRNVEAQRERTLADNPGLAEALQTNHRIVRDIASRFEQFGSLSAAQIGLVFKLAREAQERASEVRAQAPTGRQTFTGVVVSVKDHETDFGVTRKMTVKVQNPDGSMWVAWTTVPAALWQTPGFHTSMVIGATVTLTATLERGKDAHFAFGKRPTLVRVDAWPKGPAGASGEAASLQTASA